jgi:hypothetical protein
VDPTDPSPKDVLTIDPPSAEETVPPTLNNGERHLDHRFVVLTAA